MKIREIYAHLHTVKLAGHCPLFLYNEWQFIKHQ